MRVFIMHDCFSFVVLFITSRCILLFTPSKFPYKYQNSFQHTREAAVRNMSLYCDIQRHIQVLLLYEKISEINRRPWQAENKISQTLVVSKPFVFEGLKCCCFYSWTLKALLCCLVQQSPTSQPPADCIWLQAEQSLECSPRSRRMLDSVLGQPSQVLPLAELMGLGRHQGLHPLANLPVGITALLWCFGLSLVVNAWMFKETLNLI